MVSEEQGLKYLGDLIEAKIRPIFANNEPLLITIIAFDPSNPGRDLIITRTPIESLRKVLDRANSLREWRERGFEEAPPLI